MVRFVPFVLMFSACGPRLDCAPAGGGTCAAAVVCCEYVDDDVQGNCYIEAEDGSGTECDGSDCVEAFAQFAELFCADGTHAPPDTVPTGRP